MGQPQQTEERLQRRSSLRLPQPAKWPWADALAAAFTRLAMLPVPTAPAGSSRARSRAPP
jgi:hypothetical protein